MTTERPTPSKTLDAKKVLKVFTLDTSDDQTPTVACIDCGARFPVLDELTGASGRCAHCEAKALEAETSENEPMGGPQGRASQRADSATNSALQGWDGKDSGDGPSDLGTPDRALGSFVGIGEAFPLTGGDLSGRVS